MVTMPIGPVPMTVLRGMRLNEYVIHGHDLMPAIGRAIPIPEWFSDRALGDAVGRMARLHSRSPHKGKSASFHLHRTDGEGEWVMRAEGGEALVESGHAKADVALRGSAEGLYWVFPKTAQLGRATVAHVAGNQAFHGVGDMNLLAVYGSTALFGLAALTLASWLFSRKDF